MYIDMVHLQFAGILDTLAMWNVMLYCFQCFRIWCLLYVYVHATHTEMTNEPKLTILFWFLRRFYKWSHLSEYFIEACVLAIIILQRTLFEASWPIFWVMISFISQYILIVNCFFLPWMIFIQIYLSFNNMGSDEDASQASKC